MEPNGSQWKRLNFAHLRPHGEERCRKRVYARLRRAMAARLEPWPEATTVRVPSFETPATLSRCGFLRMRTEVNSSARVGQHARQRAGLLPRLDLLVDRFGDLLQPRTIGRAADDERHVVLDPEHRTHRADRAIAQRTLRLLLPPAKEGETAA